MSVELVERALIAPTASVADAMRRMGESTARIVLVVDDERHLIGVATDGDVRRWILSGGRLDELVERVMNREPSVVGPVYDREDVERLMVERHIECVPVVDGEGRLLSAVWWLDLFEADLRPVRTIDLPVVVMAGGAGTRLGHYTRVLPKPLIPVGDTPVVQLIMDRFARVGCEDFHLTLGYKAELIRAYFSDVEMSYRVRFVEESRPLGTGGSLSLLRDRLDDTFMLTNCDVLVDADYADLVDVHRESGNVVTVVASLKHYAVPYGVCDVGEGGSLARIREKPHFDFLVSTGLYVMEPSVLDDVPDDTPLHVTDIINEYLSREVKIGVYPVPGHSWTDVGEMDLLHDAVDRLGEV